MPKTGGGIPTMTRLTSQGVMDASGSSSDGGGAGVNRGFVQKQAGTGGGASGGADAGLDTIRGVFLPCLQNILGVLLFIR